MTSESRLLDRASTYDAQALAEIYDSYAEPIYHYLYRYLGNVEVAEDLTSEVFVKLLQVLNTPQAPRSQLRGWLYRVAHNLAMDWFRHQSRNATMSLDDNPHSPEPIELPANGDPPPVAMEKLQTQQRLRAAIRKLTAAQQQVILLRFGEGLKISEVSSLMGKNEGAVKILQHRALKRLRKLLEGK
jgi:RNA polymerase sigma-70 factor (ECF subfamily)